MEDETEEGVLAVSTSYGYAEWKNSAGERHRINGPALIDPGWAKQWIRNGKLHRDDGPAIIYADGENRWYKNNKLHRDDGPAVEWSSVGVEDWWKDGEPYEPSAHDLMLWKMKKKEC